MKILALVAVVLLAGCADEPSPSPTRSLPPTSSPTPTPEPTPGIITGSGNGQSHTFVLDGPEVVVQWSVVPLTNCNFTAALVGVDEDGVIASYQAVVTDSREASGEASVEVNPGLYRVSYHSRISPEFECESFSITVEEPG